LNVEGAGDTDVYLDPIEAIGRGPHAECHRLLPQRLDDPEAPFEVRRTASRAVGIEGVEASEIGAHERRAGCRSNV
jgi:hypothetical protein